MDEPACTIRRAVPKDAGPLAELAARTFRDTYGPSCRPGDVADHLARTFAPGVQLAEISSPELVTLLAVCGGLVAFAQLRHSLSPDGPTDATPARQVELWRFYVDRVWHGRGLADRMMRAALAEAFEAGATSVRLCVWEHNPRAIAFYRRRGFVDTGAQEIRFGAEVQTDRVMVRDLTTPPPAGACTTVVEEQ